MQHRHQHTELETLQKNFAEEAHCLREQAKLLPYGAVRDATIRKARQAETGSHLTDWLRSPGLKGPR